MKMTPQEFKEKQKALGWNNVQIAECLGISKQTVSNYRCGVVDIPVPVGRLLEQTNKHIKTTKISPQEFKEKQKALRWGNEQMAEYLGVSSQTVSNYRCGATNIPITITRLLEQANKRGNIQMTPQEFIEKQEALGWNNEQMAEHLGVCVSAVYNYRRGVVNIRGPIIRLLEQTNKHVKITKITKMTPQEFKEKQKALGLNNKQMAEYLGVSVPTVSLYRSGATDIPRTVARLLGQSNTHDKMQPKWQSLIWRAFFKRDTS